MYRDMHNDNYLTLLYMNSFLLACRVCNYVVVVIKCSLPVTASAGGVGGAQGPGRPKMAKSPAINNIHGKHARPMPGPPGLPNNSLLHQVCQDLVCVYVLRVERVC